MSFRNLHSKRWNLWELEGMAIHANFYKCGEKTEYPHFGVWKHPGTPKPDFHRPESFGEIVLE